MLSSRQAWCSGKLLLLYRTRKNGDNRDAINVAVAAVPEPATWAMMFCGFALAGSLGAAVTAHTGAR